MSPIWCSCCGAHINRLDATNEFSLMRPIMKRIVVMFWHGNILYQIFSPNILKHEVLIRKLKWMQSNLKCNAIFLIFFMHVPYLGMLTMFT